MIQKKKKICCRPTCTSAGPGFWRKNGFWPSMTERGMSILFPADLYPLFRKKRLPRQPKNNK